MRKLAVALIAVAACVIGATQSSPAARTAQCGLPDTKPLWLDYAEGSVSFRNDVFARPGVIAATSGVQNATDLRAGGAQTVYWWMKLNKLAGTPSAPLDPATIPDAVADMFSKAVAATGCETPLIVLNELNSAGTTTPWTDTNAQYRANVLDVLRRLVERGALPVLLISARPYTGGDAVGWWQQASQSAVLVREVYFPAPPVMRAGAVVGSRTMRQRFRDGVAPLRAIGIRADRLGVVIGFQSGPGKGGREGLKPTTAWLRLVKLETLAAKQVAAELGLGTVVSWGWGTFDQAGADADKPKAACVYLWARDPALCDGRLRPVPASGRPSTRGRSRSRPASAAPSTVSRSRSRDVSALARVTGDTQVALSALFARTMESAGHPVSSARVVALEQSIVDVRFHGRRSAYASALRARHASVTLAREVIADQLRRRAIARGLRIEAPTSAQVALYYRLYSMLPVRQVRADRSPTWLGGRRRGFALVPPGPERAALTAERRDDEHRHRGWLPARNAARRVAAARGRARLARGARGSSRARRAGACCRPTRPGRHAPRATRSAGSAASATCFRPRQPSTLRHSYRSSRSIREIAVDGLRIPRLRECVAVLSVNN